MVHLPLINSTIHTYGDSLPRTINENYHKKKKKIKKKKKNIKYIVEMDLDMILVEALDQRIGEEIILRWYTLSLTSCPLHVLFLSSIALIVIHQTQY